MKRNIFAIYIILTTAYFILIHPVFAAATPTPTSAPSAFDSFFQWLSGGLSQTKVPDTLERVNNASVPFGVQEGIVSGAEPLSGTPMASPSGTIQNTDIVAKTAGGYSNCVNAQTPYQTSADAPPFDFWDTLGRLFSDPSKLFQFGNQKAVDCASEGVPQKAAESIVSQNTYIGEVSNTALNTNVMGAQSDQSQSRVMIDAMQQKECGSLPMGVCDGVKIANANTISPYPTTPSTGAYPTPTIVTPTPSDNSISEVNPDPNGPCNGNGGDYCSASCLSHYWNPHDAEIASYICLRESAGRPFVVNDGCLKGTSVDYSIGLFQINLLAHCTASGPHYTWHPPSCSFDNNHERNICEQRLKSYDANIQEAVTISGNGTNWCPWSTARPKYCSQ